MEDKNGDGVVVLDEFEGPALDKRLATEAQLQRQQQQSQQQPANPNANAQNQNDNQQQPPANVFKILDQNGDGVVSREEYFTVMEQNDDTAQLFAREDKNGDGQIQFAEFDGPKGQPNNGNGNSNDKAAQPAAATEETLTPEQLQQAREQRRQTIFQTLDANSDGQVTRDEFFTAVEEASADNVALWEKEDKNADGVLTLDEFDGPPMMTPQQRRMPPAS